MPAETCDQCGQFAAELYYVPQVGGTGLTAGDDGMVCLRCRGKHAASPAPPRAPTETDR